MKKITPKIIRVSHDRLQLDNQNPRIPAKFHNSDLEEIWQYMKKNFELEELASSITENGFFEGQPLVAIPIEEIKEDDIHSYNQIINQDNSSSKFIVVEGNRRLSTIQGLLDDNEFNDYQVNDTLRQQFNSLPVVIYPNRDSVASFIGVHHLAGVRKWGIFERATYIVKQIRQEGQSIQKLQTTIGDKRNSARKLFVSYRLVELAKEFDNTLNIKEAENQFSYILVATSSQSIREYIGLKYWNDIEDLENPIPKESLQSLSNLFNILFGTNQVEKVIRDSRKISEKLSLIIDDEDATLYLLEHRDLDIAFKKVGGDVKAIEKFTKEIDQASNQVRQIIEDIKYTSPTEMESIKNSDLQNKYSKILDIINQIKHYIA